MQKLQEKEQQKKHLRLQKELLVQKDILHDNYVQDLLKQKLVQTEKQQL